MQLRLDNSGEIEDQKYQVEGVVTKECQEPVTLESLQKQLLSIRYDADKYYQRLNLYTKRFTVDVNDGFGGFISSLLEEVQS